MSSQTFFHETPHANFGLYLEDSPDLEFTIQQIRSAVTALDQKNKDIYRVICNVKQQEQVVVQIFVAPHLRYRELAERMLSRYQDTGRISYHNKDGRNCSIRKDSFKDKLQAICHHPQNSRQQLPALVTEIKQHFADSLKPLENGLKRLADEYGMGVVKHQEYYAGLAETWLEPRQPA